MIDYMKFSKELASEYLEKGYWSNHIYADFWERNAKQIPDKEAVVGASIRITWAEANLQADRVAMGLRELGIKKQEIMLIQTQDCWEHILMRLAAEKAGIVTLPLMRTLRTVEIEHLLNLTGATAIVIPKEYRDHNYYEMVKEIQPRTPNLKHIFIVGDDIPEGTVSVKELSQRPLEKKYPASYLQEVRTRPEEIGTLTATTGTTGLPKLTQWILAIWVKASESHNHAWEMNENDVNMSLAPLPGFGGTVTYRCAPLVGAKIVLLENYTPENALTMIEKERVSIIALAPTQLIQILDHPDFDSYDLSSLRIIRPSGGPTAPSVIEEAERRIGCKVLISYGGTDFGSITHMSVKASQNARLFTVGKPVESLQIKLLDDDGNEANEGEITVKGPCTADGYFRDAEATKAAWGNDNWGKTGDLGKLDEEGNLVILGRKKDVIIRGGQNIFPVEIERYLLSHPGVKEVAIVGIPDRLMGEIACAAVVPNGDPVTLEELVNFLREKKIAPYKLPQRIMIYNELPLAGDTKINKKQIRADVVEQIKAEGIAG